MAVVAMVGLHSQDPRKWNVAGPKEGEKYFQPSLARTATGNFIPAETLMMDDYCQKCHPDVHAGWSRQRAPLQLVQQRRLSGQRPGDARGVAEARRQRARPRAGAPAATTRCRSSAARSTIRSSTCCKHPTAHAGHHLHRLPRDHARQQHARQRRLHDRGAAALSVRHQRQRALAVDQQPARQGQAGVAQEDVPQAVPQDGRVLLDVPQGEPAAAS